MIDSLCLSLGPRIGTQSGTEFSDVDLLSESVLIGSSMLAYTECQDDVTRYLTAFSIVMADSNRENRVMLTQVGDPELEGTTCQGYTFPIRDFTFGAIIEWRD